MTRLAEKSAACVTRIVFYTCRGCRYMSHEVLKSCPDCGAGDERQFMKQYVDYQLDRHGNATTKLKVARILLPHINELRVAREAGVSLGELTSRFPEFVQYHRLRDFLLDFGILEAHIDLYLKRTGYSSLVTKEAPLDGTIYLVTKNSYPAHVLMPVPEYRKLVDKARKYDELQKRARL